MSDNRSRARSLVSGVAFATLAALLLAGQPAGPSPAAADTAFAWPAGLAAGEFWPACVDPADDYCVESATLDGVDVPRGPTGDADGAGYAVSVLPVQPGEVGPASFNWAVQGAPDDPFWSLPDAAAGEPAVLVVRVGGFMPRYTLAISDGIRVEVQEASGHRTLTVSGAPTEVNWGLSGGPCTTDSCGSSDSQATGVGVVFSGNTQDLATFGAEGISMFEGMAVATNAQAKTEFPVFQPDPNPEDPADGDAWLIDLANPHYAARSTNTAVLLSSGSFTAQIPANYLTAIHRSAASTSFTVLRTLDGVTTSLPATSTPTSDGGIVLRLEGITYSTPALRIQPVNLHQGLRAMAVSVRAGVWTTLPATTVQGRPVTYGSSTPAVCHLRHGSVWQVQGTRAGACRLRLTAAATTGYWPVSTTRSVTVVPPLVSTVTGWSTAPAKVRAGAVLTDAVRVRTGSGYVVRTVVVQRRLAGTTRWVPLKPVRTAATGAVVAWLPVPSKGIWQFRLTVVPTPGVLGAVTALRRVAATG